MSKPVILIAAAILLGILLVAGVYIYITRFKNIQSPIAETIDEITEKPLEKYSFVNLRTTQFAPSEILLGRELETTNEEITSQMFYYSVADPKDPEKKLKVSGLINMPKEPGTYPVIVMFRGFVERDIYETGVGTRRSGEIFAKNGFITVAPDFLGYGESDIAEVSSLEDRFLTYPTALTLLESTENLDYALQATYSGAIRADTTNVGIWGHSNGGHIALSALAISGEDHPTVLWNPVTKPFPYSILFFTDEYDDEGKALRKVIADFEKDYDVFLYSPAKYYDWIKAPIQLHQGINDDAVPVKWSNQFVEIMEEKEKEIEYFAYPDADHNLMPSGWDTAVERSMEFYKEKLNR